MRTETTTRTLYKFSELTDEAKQTAIEKLLGINVDYKWWESIYDDANNVGIDITGFDIDRASYCNIENYYSWPEVAQNILNEHGESSDTYKAANDYLNAHNELFARYMDEQDELYETYEAEDNLNGLEEEFESQLSQCYLSILRNEYDYLTSEAAIIYTIEANDYEFTEDGELA